MPPPLPRRRTCEARMVSHPELRDVYAAKLADLQANQELTKDEGKVEACRKVTKAQAWGAGGGD